MQVSRRHKLGISSFAVPLQANEKQNVSGVSSCSTTSVPLPPCNVCECYPSVSRQCQPAIQRAVTSCQCALVRPFAAALPDSRPEEMWVCMCVCMCVCQSWGEKVVEMLARKQRRKECRWTGHNTLFISRYTNMSCCHLWLWSPSVGE